MCSGTRVGALREWGERSRRVQQIAQSRHAEITWHWLDQTRLSSSNVLVPIKVKAKLNSMSLQRCTEYKRYYPVTSFLPQYT